MTLTVSHDLRNLFGPARDQGSRPTCLAFAASDTHAAKRGAWAALSCEYAYYHAQRRGNRAPTTGAVLSDMLVAIREDGQPIESGWAYLAPPIDAASWTPPATATPVFKREGESILATVDEVIKQLNAGHPVLILTTISQSFYMATANVPVENNEVPDPKLRHAVIAVAHGERNGERIVLIRNSWGVRWGNEGYAWITEQYLAPRIFELAILKEDLSVPGNSTAA